DLASFDTQNEDWVAESGSYVVSIGASSKDIKQTAKFRLGKELIVEKDQKVLTPQVSISELKK
ncbi:MAG: hypothetical protein ACXVA2_23105, partial [Mucilaginibacter sp.]